MPNQKKQKKLNPLNIDDKEVANNIDMARQNFVELFRRCDQNRLSQSSSTTAVVSVASSSVTNLPWFDVSLPVTGQKPVLVGFGTERILSTFGGGVTLSGDLSTLSGILNGTMYFYADNNLINRYSFGNIIPATQGKFLTGIVPSGGSASSTGWSSSKAATGTYNLSWTQAFTNPPSVVVSLNAGTTPLRFLTVTSATTTGAQVYVQTTGGAATDESFSFIAALNYTGNNAAWTNTNANFSLPTSSLFTLHYPTQPGVVNYTFKGSTTSADCSMAFGLGTYAFAVELF